MVNTLFATKIGMSQAWTTSGKRVAVTRCKVQPNLVVAAHTPKNVNSASDSANSQPTILEIGYGTKKLKNMTKPLRSKLEKSGFSVGARQLKGVTVSTTQEDESPAVGSTITVADVLSVGDMVKVQGTSKGRGFAGGIKRHGFHGGPKTHGQSDRERAVGSIGAGTYPGKVWKGKKMPGHYGVDTKTVSGLVVLHVDPNSQEVWLSGPVPGFQTSTVQITKTGKTKSIDLDAQASGIPQVSEEQNDQVEAQEQEVVSDDQVASTSEEKDTEVEAEEKADTTEKQE